MLYVFYGQDSAKAHDKAQALSHNLLQKKPDASLFNLDSETWAEEKLSELTQSQGLFEKKYIVCIDARAFLKESLEGLVERLPQIKESPHICIVVAAKLDVKTLKVFTKYAEKIQEFGVVEKEEKRDFRMTDALGSRDKKRLWVLYREAIDQGKEPEEIHGLLFWQIKNMIIAAESKDASEAGLNPFVFRKAKESLKYYSKEDLCAVSSRMITVYHEARQGKIDFVLGLEKLLLTL